MARKGSRIAFLVFVAVLLVGFGAMMRPFWVPAGLALVAAMILRPVHERVEGWLRGRRYVAALVSLVLTCVCIMTPLGVVVGTILVEGLRFSRNVTEVLQAGQLAQSLDAMSAWFMDIASPVREWIGDWNVREALLAVAHQVGGTLYQYSPKVLVTTASFGAQVVFWLIFLFTFFADGPRLYHYFMSLAPIDERHERFIAREVRGMVSAVFLGMVANSAANAVLMTIAFAICGIDRPWMWGLVTFGFAFIPVVGTTIIWAGGAAYLLLHGAWGYALGLSLFGVGIVAQVDNVVKPLVMRGRVKIHPVLLLLSILGGMLAMGPVGLVFGPVFIAIVIAALQIYQKEFL